MPVHLDGSYTWYLGRLSLSWIPYQNPIVLGAFVFAVSMGILVLTMVVRYRLIGVIWYEWLTSLDHKKIGLMYMIIGAVMLFRGFVEAAMMRTQQAMAVGPHSAGYLGAVHGFLPPFHFDQLYGSHGTIMIVFAVTPLLVGLMNIIVPLQIGARDMAYPYMNSLALMLTGAGAGLMMISLFVGEFTHAGWVGLTPLTEMAYSPGVGVDYWLWALQISGIGTTIGSINI
nr:cbb3-type cytochrome c oxidase subunit I [Salinisphaera sp.]